ncbi:MAG: hypothetical protein WC223_12485 [Bacteroidales bacterium]|jgi:hypothetical protein
MFNFENKCQPMFINETIYENKEWKNMLVKKTNPNRPIWAKNKVKSKLLKAKPYYNFFK